MTVHKGLLKVKWLLPAIFLINSWVSAQAQNPQVLFDQANSAYAKGDYAQAIDLYENILKSGVISGEVYFNLGNAYFKSDRIGYAILYYEKAKKYLDGDPSLDHNLKLARMRIVDQIDEIPVIFIEQWWRELIHLFPINTYLWLCLAFFTLLMLFLIVKIYLHRSWLKNLIWMILILFLLTVVCTTSQIYEFETTKFGIILDEKISVVSEPGLSGKEVFILHEGTKVEVKRQLDDWLEITIPDGKTGWVKKSDLDII
jgi:tetratricopeptide (TPR) repeat protein